MTEEIYQLAVDVTLKTISGKWKTSILCHLGMAPLRTGELKRKLPGISQRILTKQLTELENDGIVKKKVYPEVPPRVEYCLTQHGMTLRKILLEMSEWGTAQAALQNDKGHNYKIIDQNLKGFEEMDR